MENVIKCMIRKIKNFLEEKIMALAGKNDILNFLNSRWEKAVCPICGKTDWDIMDGMFELRELSISTPKFRKGNGGAIPLIAMTCGHCGNTMFINAESVIKFNER